MEKNRRDLSIIVCRYNRGIGFNPDCAVDFVARVEKAKRNANMEQF